jgi:hypothetical protein
MPLLGNRTVLSTIFESVVNTAPTIASGATATFAENGTEPPTKLSLLTPKVIPLPMKPKPNKGTGTYSISIVQQA